VSSTQPIAKAEQDVIPEGIPTTKEQEYLALVDGIVDSSQTYRDMKDEVTKYYEPSERVKLNVIKKWFTVGGIKALGGILAGGLRALVQGLLKTTNFVFTDFCGVIAAPIAGLINYVIDRNQVE
jgi:hypothetical protein